MKNMLAVGARVYHSQSTYKSVLIYLNLASRHLHVLIFSFFSNKRQNHSLVCNLLAGYWGVGPTCYQPAAPVVSISVPLAVNSYYVKENLIVSFGIQIRERYSHRWKHPPANY